MARGTDLLPEFLLLLNNFIFTRLSTSGNCFCPVLITLQLFKTTRLELLLIKTTRVLLAQYFSALSTLGYLDDGISFFLL